MYFLQDDGCRLQGFLFDGIGSNMFLREIVIDIRNYGKNQGHCYNRL